MLRKLRLWWWEAQIEGRYRAMRKHAERCCGGAADGPCTTWDAMCSYWDDALDRYRALL